MVETDLSLSTSDRQHPLEHSVFASGGAALTPAPEAYRLSLRAGSRALAPLSKALGVELPRKPKTSASQGSRTALWLGPDEWLIIDAENNPIDDCMGAKAVHSSVDISHRNTAILVSGPRAADVINAGCPQDLGDAAFPVGATSRTILGKTEIVLYRSKATLYRVEVWRSFSAYAFAFLADAIRDVGNG